MKRKVIITSLIILSVVLGGIILALGLFMISSGKTQKQYSAIVIEAKKYLENGDFENAVIKFKQAIEVDEKNEDAYAQLAAVYYNNSFNEQAYNILIEGYNATKSKKLYNILVTYFPNGLPKKEQANEGHTEQGVKTDDSISMNRDLIGMIASYTEKQYSDKFGAAGIQDDGMFYTLKYNGCNANFIYYDIEGDKVINTALNRPYENKMPIEANVDDLSDIFIGMGDTISFEQLKELSLTDLKCTNDKGNNYVIFAYCGCRFSILSNANGDIESKEAENRIVPINRTESEGKKGTVRGLITDALTGNGVDGVSIKLRERADHTGTVLAETITGLDGYYQVEVAEGEYTVEIAKEKYISEFFDAVVKEDGNFENNLTMSPEVPEGEIRIVLTWDENPADLDSHLEGTDSSGNYIHVWFSNQASEHADLDLDDTNSYGPETITIHDIRGEFEYYVVDFNHTGMLSQSGAQVKVYLPGDSQPVVYDVGEGTGEIWRVFKIKDGQITTIDSIGD